MRAEVAWALQLAAPPVATRRSCEVLAPVLRLPVMVLVLVVPEAMTRRPMPGSHGQPPLRSRVPHPATHTLPPDPHTVGMPQRVRQRRRRRCRRTSARLAPRMQPTGTPRCSNAPTVSAAVDRRRASRGKYKTILCNSSNRSIGRGRENPHRFCLRFAAFFRSCWRYS